MSEPHAVLLLAGLLLALLGGANLLDRLGVFEGRWRKARRREPR